jgi:predicted AlkP superfamily phosphohydrolase/phosphomutase/Flp pilus assembly protein TadD
MTGRLIALLLLPVLAAGCGRKTERSEAAKAVAPSASSPAVEAADVVSRPRRPPGGSAPVLWLGLDGLDWELLDRLSADGKMPNWTRLVREGHSLTLKSFMPVLSPILWTTAATGVGPDLHRVLDFEEVDPKTGRKVPVSGQSRAVPALWNVASASGKKVGVVGWWATHPAEKVNGFFVSDRASPVMFTGLPRSGVAYPPSLAAGVDQVAARDGQVAGRDLQAYLDVAPEEISGVMTSGKGMENPIVALGRILGSTRVVHRIGRDLYDRHHPDLFLLYLQGTDEIAHVFASYAPPKLECTSPDDYQRYHRVVEVYYAAVDRMLGQWIRRAEEDGATLIVHSDHGFKWGSRRTCERSSRNWNTAAYWHRLEGVFVAWGARVSPSTVRAEASIFDVAPTVASLLAMPADRRTKGAPMTKVFRGLQRTARRDLFASVRVRRVPAEPLSEKEASEYAKKLVALGYLSGSEPRALEASGGDRPGMTEGAWNNLGLYLRETAKDFEAARAAFEKSLAIKPGYASPMFNLAVLHRMSGKTEAAHDWLFRSLDAGHADPEGTIGRWLEEYQEKGQSSAFQSLLERASSRYPQNELFARELGLARFRARNCPAALDAVSRFEAVTRDPATLNALGLFQTCLGRRPEAIALFERSLVLKPDQPGVVESLRVVRRGPPPGGR